MNGFDALISELDAFSRSRRAAAAEASKPASPKLAKAATVCVPPGGFARLLLKASALAKTAQRRAAETPERRRERVRAGVEQTMAKALAAQAEGHLSALEVIRLEREANHILARISK